MSATTDPAQTNTPNASGLQHDEVDVLQQRVPLNAEETVERRQIAARPAERLDLLSAKARKGHAMQTWNQVPEQARTSGFWTRNMREALLHHTPLTSSRKLLVAILRSPVFRIVNGLAKPSMCCEQLESK